MGETIRGGLGRWSLGLATALLLAGCGGGAPPPPPGTAAATAGPAEAAEPPIEAYQYPPTVSGNYDEINVGTFDLVDGIAWQEEAGTVVWATSEPIASPALAGSACPVALARSIALLRDASWVEVTIDAKGKSNYHAAGTQYAGSSREQEVGGKYWQVDVERREAERISGAVTHRTRGRFDFDLAILRAEPAALSEGERMDHGWDAAGPLTPDADAAKAAYLKLRDAARAHDWPAFLAAHGYDADLVRKLRGLDGIAEDLERHADRFLSPGDPEEVSLYATIAGVGARGTNSRGEAFFNFYQFAPCGDRLVLVGIGENPQ